jgi:hypothetical protein
MKTIKKGDIVSRNSHQNDILFYVEKIIESEDRAKTAILKGITIRIEADAPIFDLKISEEKRVKETLNRIKQKIEETEKVNNRNIIKYGKILHLDRRQKLQYQNRKILQKTRAKLYST